MISHKPLDIINHWKEILGLENETIKSVEVPESHFLNKELYPGAYVFYECDNKRWVIVYGKNIEQKDLIHEIGHIYLLKHLNWFDIHKSPRKERPKFNKDIKRLYNGLLDCFNEHHLYRFEEYMILHNEFLVSELECRYIHFNNVPLAKPLGMYLFFYIAYNFIIIEQIRDDLAFYINYFLAGLREHIIKKAKDVGKEINQEIFIRLDAELDKFNQIKDTRHIKIINDFIYEILSIFPYWSKKELLEQLNLISRL